MKTTTIAVNVATILEKSSEQTLPSLYAFVPFNSNPTTLGLLTLARSLAQALASPIGGVLGNSFHRGRVIALGCLLWGACALVFSTLTRSLFVVALVDWAVAGVALAFIVPSCQSLLADTHVPEERGRAFGVMQCSSFFGAVVGGIVTTNLAASSLFTATATTDHDDKNTKYGWRIACIFMALCSFMVGWLNYTWVVDHRHERHNNNNTDDYDKGCAHTLAKTKQTLVHELKHLMSIPTFIILVVQGIWGNVPWAALTFLTAYFQLLRFSAFTSSLLVALFLGSVGVGGYLGGYLGDCAAVLWPFHGRIVVAQLSVAAGIPCAYILTTVLPAHITTDSTTDSNSNKTVVMYGIFLVVFGVVKAWPGPAANNPIFAELVNSQQRGRSLIYAFDRCLETALSACTAPLVGVMANRMFGFQGGVGPTGDAAVDVPNALALGKALYWFLVVPWMLVLILYGGLHRTYASDVRRQQEQQQRHTAVGGEGGDEQENGEEHEIVALRSGLNSDDSIRIMHDTAM